MGKKIKDTSKPQKKISSRKIIEELGAEDTGLVLDPHRGPISLLELRQFLRERLVSGGGRPKLAGASDKRNKIPLLDDDWEKLEGLAEYYSETAGLKTTPGQIASAILHLQISKMNIGKLSFVGEKKTKRD